MHQNLLNAEFASGEYQNAENKNMHVIRVMKALTKVLHKSFRCIYACLSSDLNIFVGSIYYCGTKDVGNMIQKYCHTLYIIYL
jgi:hypothetical protein